MNEAGQQEWDEFGVRWRALDPDLGAISAGLQAQLRRQSRWIAAGIASLAAICAGGLVLGIATLWIGWHHSTWNFLFRGGALLVVSSMLATSIRSLLSVRSASHASTLSAFIDLSIRRTTSFVLFARLCLWVCGAVAVLGLGGTAIRTHMGDPPRMSPFVDLALLALLAIALYACRHVGELRLRSYEQLERALIDR